jgi:hypothetical protein
LIYEKLYRKFSKAKFWLNPHFEYDVNPIKTYENTICGLLDMIKKHAYRNSTLQNKVTGEMKLFRNAEHDFD